MAKHIDNINRTGVQKKGSTAKSIGIAVAAILGIIVIYARYWLEACCRRRNISPKRYPSSNRSMPVPT